jgi:hypothetical protein
LQDALDEHVLAQDHVLPAVRAEALEGAARPFRPVRPRQRRDDCLHVDDAGDALRVVPRPLEAQRRAPVVNDEDYSVAQREGVPKRPEVVALLGVAVAVGAGGRELGTVAHADQIAGDEPPEAGAVGHDVAPQVGRRGVAVLEHDRRPGALVDVAHAPTFDIGELLGGERLGRYRHG